MSGRKRVHLSIKDKLELLKKLDNGYSVNRVCEIYGVKKQTVSDIRKARDKLKAYSLNFDVDASTSRGGCTSIRKHMKVASSKDLEEAVYKWYVQERSVNVNVRGTEIVDAAVKLAKHMGIPFSGSSGWLWRFRNRHGICNKVAHGEAGSGDDSAIEPFRKVLKDIIRNEDLHLNQIYNADETGLFWRSLPVNTQAFKDEDKVPGKKISKEKFSALLGANASGTHRLKPVVVGKAAKPRCLKDHMHELPVIYYHTKNAWFNSAIFSDWFKNHFIPEVRRYQEQDLKIAPEDVKAILLLDNAPAHPRADTLVSEDGRIKVVFLPPNTTALIQPMDQGIIAAAKRIYTRKYLGEVLVVIPEEGDEEEDSRGVRTLAKIKSYNLKCAIFNFANAWKSVKISTLANCWKKLLEDSDPDLDFEGFEVADFHKVFQVCGEKDVTVQDVEQWIDDGNADPGYQVLSLGEIAEQVQQQEEEESSDSDEEDVPAARPKMAAVRESIDTLLAYIDSSSNLTLKSYYHHMRAVQDIIIKEQYTSLTQRSIQDFFKPPPPPRAASPPPPSPPRASSPPPPPSPTPSTSSFSGFE